MLALLSRRVARWLAACGYVVHFRIALTGRAPRIRCAGPRGWNLCSELGPRGLQRAVSYPVSYRFHTLGFIPRFHTGFIPVSYRTEKQAGFIPRKTIIAIYMYTCVPVHARIHNRRIVLNRFHPQNRLQKICGISTTWPAKVRQKRSKTHSPRRPLWRPGGARRAPCGFCSVLLHRFGRACGGSPAECQESVPGAESVSVDPLIYASRRGSVPR